MDDEGVNGREGRKTITVLIKSHKISALKICNLP